jgi:exonuclease SbcC
MIIKSVAMRDFISHENTEIEFPLGVTVIVGPNGAGKTSILDAIVFGLFNRRERGERFDDLIRRSCNSAEVRITFEEGKNIYKVSITRKKKGVEAFLEREGFGIVATSVNEVSREISRIIEMDGETALKSIIVRQGEIARLLEEDPKERKNLFGKLLGIENLERAWDNMRHLIDHFREYYRKDYERLKSEVDLRKKDLNKLSSELEALKKEIRELEEKFSQKSVEYGEIEKEVEELKKRREEYERLSKELERIRKEIELREKELEETRERLKKAREAKIEAEKLKAEVEKIPMVEELIRLSESIETKKQRLEEKRLELEKIQSHKRALKETEKAYSEYRSLEKAIEELKKREEGLRGTDNLKAERAAKLKHLENSLNSDSAEFERLRSKILKYLPEISPEAKKSELERLQKEKEEIERGISECKEEKGKLEGRRKEIREYLEILGDSSVCPVCRSDLTPEHRERVKSEFQEEIEKIKSQLKNLEDRLKALNSRKREIETRLGEIQKLDVDRALELQKKLEEYKSGIEILKKELNELEPKVRELENVRNEIKELEDRMKTLREYYESYTAAKRVLEMERDEEEVISEIEKLEKEIEAHKRGRDELVGKLGYIPEDPRRELEGLRAVKERFYSLNALALQVADLENAEKTKEAELKSAREREAGILDGIRRTDFRKEKLDKAEKELKEIGNEVSELKAKIEEKKDLKEKKEEEKRSLSERITELERDLERMEKIKNFVEKDLETVRAAFSRDGVQKLLRKKAAPEISGFARRYVEAFNLDITDIEVTEDFDVSVIKGGEAIPLSSLSGGEKVAVAIALRLAIAKAISGRISTVIMDEPTTHLDEERRRELVGMMRDFFREGSSIPQMIIVTHHRELEEVADTVYRVEKVGGISRVVEER